MRLVNFLLLFVLISFVGYQWVIDVPELSGSRWTCHELSKNFTSAPYQKYQEIGERDVLYFASSSNLTIYQTGQLLFKNGEKEKYEVIIDVSYKVKKNKLSLTYKNIDWHLKPSNAPVFVQDLDSLKGFESDLKFMINDDQLYFFNRLNNEDSNFICFSA